jgi:RimJ/RimL family protein N-acetyltransferase
MFIGNQITLGAFVPEDYGPMYCWANDVVAARDNGAFRPVNLRDMVTQCEAAGKDPTQVMLAIRRRSEAKIIGYLHIHNINMVHRSAELGIRIGEERNRGKGYGKEALTMALSYCWDHLNLERIGLVVFRDNARALSAYKAVGFKKEGLMRKLLFVDGAWVDVVVMAAFRPSRRSRKTVAAAPSAAANAVENLLQELLQGGAQIGGRSAAA